MFLPPILLYYTPQKTAIAGLPHQHGPCTTDRMEAVTAAIEKKL
jgi:hypothetical protein